MYACVCDWLGFPYREEVQWVSACRGLELFSVNCTNDERAGTSSYLEENNSSVKMFLIMVF